MGQSDFVLVETADRLEDAKRGIGKADMIGVDTEYDSFRYFREILCLIQVSTDSMVYLFDPLIGLDLSFLGEVFSDRRVLKVLHACDNDIRLLNRDFGFEFAHIFDTHRAAALLGSSLLSLPSILKEYLDLELKKEKKIQRSRWDIRPLTEEQLYYAARDVIFLIPLYRKLDEELRTGGLELPAAESFEGMTLVRWREKTLDKNGYTKIKGFDDLDEDGRKRLKKLYYWRFEKARAINRARFMILSDNDLLALAQRNIDSLESLERSGILSSQKNDEIGGELIKVLQSHEGPPE
jgi:ribonuclease D